MTDIKTVSERRWSADDLCQVSEFLTTNPQEPSVFGLAFREQGRPLTRRELGVVRELIDKVLGDAPERRIALL